MSGLGLRCWGWCGWLLLGWLCLGGPAWAGHEGALHGGAQVSRLAESWIQQGDDEPERLLAVLNELAKLERLPAGVSRGLWVQAVLRTQAQIAARSGRVKAMQIAIEQLRQLDPQRQNPLVRADQALALAQYEDLRGQSAEARSYALAAQADYAQACQDPQRQNACDERAWWRSMRLLILQASEEGEHVQARDWAQRSLVLARHAGDASMELRSLLALADAQHALRQPELVRQHLQAAAKVAAQADVLLAWVHLYLAQVRHSDRANTTEFNLRQLAKAQSLAQLLGSARLEALVQRWLAQCWIEQGQYAKALQATQQALQVAKQHRDLRLQARLLHLAGLARLNLQQTVHGRADLESAQALWQLMKARAAQAHALREYSETLAKVGDAAGALKLYHQERGLLDDIERRNREALVGQLREQFAVAAQRRELAGLQRERALSQSQLANQNLVMTVAVLTFSVLVLAGVLGVLWVLRTRDANQQLRRNEALLRLQSERDALTGLANRRHFQEMLQADDLLSHFQGAVLLLDIDYFKRINDVQGHAVGDGVLAEVARRIATTVRAGDLSCRWGGEEFLVFARQLHGDGLDALAQRLLHAVGDQPVALPNGQALAVSTSVGYASFPLPEQFLPVSWERALKLADMALYAAKAGGRDRAVGVHALSAGTQIGDLDALARDFDLQGLERRAELRCWVR
jgi:diguanylate cyclase (GGDEF)-like protein